MLLFKWSLIDWLMLFSALAGLALENARKTERCGGRKNVPSKVELDAITVRLSLLIQYNLCSWDTSIIPSKLSVPTWQVSVCCMFLNTWKIGHRSDKESYDQGVLSLDIVLTKSPLIRASSLWTSFWQRVLWSGRPLFGHRSDKESSDQGVLSLEDRTLFWQRVLWSGRPLFGR